MRNKFCGRCGKEKPLDEFAERFNYKGVRTPTVCLDCKREADRMYYHKYKNRRKKSEKLPSSNFYWGEFRCF
jgi:hypothetical protein